MRWSVWRRRCERARRLASTRSRQANARAFARWIGRYVSALIIYIGYLWMLWDKEKQCWHDKFASDVVVRVSD
jgi:uncharacterized RDD family membrane protein YckC